MLVSAAVSYTLPGWNWSYPRIQILTIAELLRGASIDMPSAQGIGAWASRATGSVAQQETLGLE